MVGSLCNVFSCCRILGVKCWVRLLCGSLSIVFNVCRLEWLSIVIVLLGRL